MDIKVLLVEDEPINLLVISKMLKSTFTIFEASSAEEGLRILDEESIDAVLVDINLGKHQPDGNWLLHQIRESESLKNLPVFALSSYQIDDLDEDANKFSKFFSKPPNKNEIIEAIRLACG